jgi:hypothetical protein
MGHKSYLVLKFTFRDWQHIMLARKPYIKRRQQQNVSLGCIDLAQSIDKLIRRVP